MLSKISLFNELTSQELLNLLQVGTNISLISGQFLFNQGETARYFYVVIDGAIQVLRKIDNRELVLATYETGKFFGEVPLLAGTPHLASGKAVSDSYLFAFPENEFWQMLLSFSSVRRIILGLMAYRMQELQFLSHQQEKLIALGTLAAGLAHELNNPASAAYRSVGQLNDLILNRHALEVKYIEQHLTAEQLEFLLALKQNVIESTISSNCLEPLVQVDQEDEIIIWLEEHGMLEGWKLAPNLVTGGLNSEKLEAISELLQDNDLLKVVLTWLEALLAEASLLNVLAQSVNRISELVNAVKTYSYVDQTPLKKKDVDVHQGLDNTLTILSHKLRKHRILVVRDYALALPLIHADGSALNQVWTNLIDNAIDVLNEQGTIWVQTSVEKDYVVVEIVDNGPGIPPEIQSSLFDLFFTTKEVGKGTGIGLALAHRIVVVEHSGNIRCFSKPGQTRFQVRLPIT